MNQAGLRGKLAAERPMMGDLSHYASASLPTPPRSFDYGARVKHYPMALNDKYGDCTIAGVVHMLQLMYAEVGEVFDCPDDSIVRDTYFWLSGGQDSGLVEHQVLQMWMQHGLFDHKIVGYAPVNVKDKKKMADALYAFGALYIGIEMPAEAEQQFENNIPWQIDAQSGPPTGGHCVVATGMNPLGIDIITWGVETSMTWEWWDRYGTEAWVVIPEIFVEAGHGPVWSLNLPALQNDLRSL
jgi:hypothetical protein